MHYKLAAFSSTRGFKTFDLNDYPLHLTEDTFVLESNGEMYNYNTVVRGCDVEDVYEGSIIWVDGTKFEAVYHCGLKVRDIENPKNLLTLPDNILKIRQDNICDEKYKGLTTQSNITYRYKDIIFTFQDIYGKGFSEGTLFVNKHGGMEVKIDEVKQYAGIKVDKKKVYFQKGQVEMKRGIVCIMT